MASLRIAIVPNLHVMDVWLKVLPHIMNGREHWEEFYTLNQLRRNLVLGQQQLWIFLKDEQFVTGCCVTQIDEFPEKKILRIAFMSGSGFRRGDIKELKKIENWGKEKGCVMMDILGRKEWGKLLAKLDYTSPGVVFRKELI